MGNSDKAFAEYVKQTIDSAVTPVEIALKPIADCDSGRAIAYRALTTVRSAVLGELSEADYVTVCDRTGTGIALFCRVLKRVIRAINLFDECDPPIEFISLRCPAQAVRKDGYLYDAVSEALREGALLRPQTLCVEFDADLFREDAEKARKALLDMKLLKVRTMITGCGSDNFPLMKLLEVPPDAVVLDEATTEWAGSRNKPRLISAMIEYLKSMDVATYAQGRAEKRQAFRNTDCVGFIDVSSPSMRPEEALAKKEAEDVG